VIGAVQGEITGLVAITPAAGFVTGWGAIIIGACSGSIPWISMNVLGRMEWMKKVDDVSKYTIQFHAIAIRLS
jgi:Amt family ammonium transporter